MLRNLSIIVPAKNEERFLPSLLESLIPQLRVEDEIIVNDNDSVDRTSCIAKKYDCDLRYVSDMWLGLNKSIAAASNPLVLVIGADCIVSNGFIARIKEHFMDERVVGVAGLFPLKDRDKTIVGSLMSNLANRLWKGVGFQCFRKEVFLKVGGYCDEQVIVPNWSGRDVELWSRLSKTGKIIYDPDLYVATDFDTVKTRTLPILAVSLPIIMGGVAIKSKAKTSGTMITAFGVGVTVSELGYRIVKGGRIAIAKCEDEKCSVDLVFHHMDLGAITLILTPLVAMVPLEEGFKEKLISNMAGFGLGLVVHGVVTSPNISENIKDFPLLYPEG